MTQPLERQDLDSLIRFHQDSLYSHRWQMSPSAATLEELTIRALKHYRDLLDVIDNREPEPDHLPSGPTLPPQDAAALPEKPK